MTAIADVLEEAGYDTFLPHRDGLEPFVMKAVNDPRLTNKAFRSLNRIVGKAIFDQLTQGSDFSNELVFSCHAFVSASWVARLIKVPVSSNDSVQK